MRNLKTLAPPLRHIGGGMVCLMTLLVCAPVHAAEVVALTPLTSAGSMLTKGYTSTLPLIYVAPSEALDATQLCRQATTRLGDGSTVMLDLSAITSTSGSKAKTVANLMQRCLVGTELPGSYFLIRLQTNTRRVLVVNEKTVVSASDLAKTVANWRD